MKTVLLLLVILALGVPALAQVETMAIEYKQGDVVLKGFVSLDPLVKEKRPGILVVPDWMGVSEYSKMRAYQMAQLGYVALAADVYGNGFQPANAQAAAAEAGKYYKDRQLYRARVRAGLDALARIPQVDTSRLAVVGYCFGGAGALELACSGAPVKAVVTFHGALATPTPEDAKNIRGSVLVLHGADDPFVKQSDVTAFMDEMRKAGVDWQLVQYGGAVHSFTIAGAGNDNSKGAAYNALADRRSWQAMKDFFAEKLGK